MFTVVSQEPGQKALLKRNVIFPLVFGFQRVFNISFRNALVIAGFPVFASSIIYFYLIQKQIFAMASSKLLPTSLLYSITLPWKYDDTNTNHIPIIAFVLLCISAFGANYFVLTVNISTASSRMAGLATTFVYITMFYCFIIFRQRYGHMERYFTNPLGIWSAIWGILVFLFLLIILVAFNLEFQNVPILYTIVMFIFLLYYYCYAESIQCFSKEEQNAFFRAYVMKSK
jgi:amino acid transporter